MSVRVRLAVSVLFGAVLVALACAPAHAALRGAEERDAKTFAADAVTLHQAGFVLRELSTATDEDGFLVLSLTLAKDDAAVRLSLEMADFGDHAVAYTRSDVAVPHELRVYPGEDALFDALAAGPVARVYDECGAWVVATAQGDALLDENGYYVVRERVTGRAAPARLARELRIGLERGARLADVTGLEGTGTIDFVLVGDQRVVLRADVDAHGKVVAVEIRESPLGWESGALPDGDKLARALKRGKSVQSVGVSFPDDGAAHVTLGLGRGKAYVIDLGTMDYEDEGCGC